MVGAKTLRQLVAEADLVLHARIVASGERVGLSTGKGGVSRPGVEAEVVEVLAGAHDAARVRFAQHGHGVATFSPGEEVLLFLRDIARSRELRALAEAGAFEWVSLQEHDEEHPLTPATRAPLLAAVRAYVAAGRAEGSEARTAAYRTATRTLLTSGDAALAAAAIRDLVLAPELPLVEREDVPRLEALLADGGVSMGVRAALLIELERRGLVEGRRFWLRWLSAASPPRDRVTALRASGAAADPAVHARAVALVDSPAAEVAAAAAASLAPSAGADALAALSRALARPERPVRYAAIRALGRRGDATARDALRAAADSHGDPDTRRRARAELAKRR